jgi:hypothetical protein
MAGLFGGGGGGDMTVTQVLDPQTQAFVDKLRANALREAQGIREAGPFTAGPTAGQLAALRGIGGIAPGAGFGQFQDISGRLASQLGQPFDPASISQFMDPFVQENVAGLRGLFGEQRAQAQQRAQQQATQAGAFGGSRGELLQAQAIGDINRQEAQAVPQLLSQGFSQALGAALGQQQLGQQTGLAGLQNLLAGTQFGTGLDLTRQQALFSGNELLRQIQSQQMQDPLLRSQAIMGTLQGGIGPFGSTQTQAGGGGNPLAGAFGGGLAGLGAAGLPGAVVGGGLGLLGGIFG